MVMGFETFIVRSAKVSPRINVHDAPRSHKNESRLEGYLLVKRYEE